MNNGLSRRLFRPFEGRLADEPALLDRYVDPQVGHPE